jgi:hypothetical protein
MIVHGGVVLLETKATLSRRSRSQYTSAWKPFRLPV